ncbi:class I SAM-dependent methyltransferase [Blastococcus xanthinilyticus]|uniref:UbiE/COQ5 methyltransferase-like protein n=1 Tax=Blastococcus xanthinilyticus TaxID=1564164 RepID=A0A5S5D7Q6_9ACTN|nr:methyltransferase domain-containing protein [Blastococcus xanthinilyticus]TYP90782.1 ubiE/COQ5 methyltransferase-like protein [Blastococcus xanthinilyticus]
MQHYDVLSWVYEYGTELLHGGHRREAIDLLRLEPGATVLDVAAGTGANFPLLIERIGASGRICAIDYSPGMLARAAAKVRKTGWDNVDLIEADARTLDAELVGLPQVDAAICVLGLSVVPDWREVFERMFGLVRSGGRVVVMDLNLDGKRTSGVANAYYRRLAQADSRRRFWEPLQSQADDVELIDHTWFGGVARIAGGTKPPRVVSPAVSSPHGHDPAP